MCFRIWLANERDSSLEVCAFCEAREVALSCVESMLLESTLLASKLESMSLEFCVESKLDFVLGRESSWLDCELDSNKFAFKLKMA